MNEALNDTKPNLASTQERMKRQVDKARRVEEWKIGDRVFLSTWNLWMFASHLQPKLKRRRVGSFIVTKIVSPTAFWLDLPPEW